MNSYRSENTLPIASLRTHATGAILQDVVLYHKISGALYTDDVVFDVSQGDWLFVKFFQQVWFYVSGLDVYNVFRLWLLTVDSEQADSHSCDFIARGPIW